MNVTLGAEASSLTLTDTALTTLKISGPSSGTAGALTFSSNAAALTSINASGDNGNLTFTDSWAGAVFTGGSGNDIVTLAAALTTASGGSITFGAGDNSLLAVPGFGSIGAGVTVDGGSSGDNTISAALVNSGNAAGIKDFQILDVSGYSWLPGRLAAVDADHRRRDQLRLDHRHAAEPRGGRHGDGYARRRQQRADADSRGGPPPIR